MVQHDAYGTALYPLIFLVGSAGTIEHWRNGELLNSLFSESVYSYDNPIFNE